MTNSPINLLLYSPSVNTIIEVTDNILGPINVPLPVLVTVGQTITVKDGTGTAGSHNITISSPLDFLIDGNPTVVLDTDWQSIDLYWNGTQWRIKASNGSGGGGGSGIIHEVDVSTGTTGTASLVNTFISFNSSTAGDKTADIPASTGSLGMIIISDIALTAGTYPISVNQPIVGVDTIYINGASLTLLDTSQGWVSI